MKILRGSGGVGRLALRAMRPELAPIDLFQAGAGAAL